MKKKNFRNRLHRLAVRWKAFWRVLDHLADDYHHDKVQHPEYYADNNPLY